MNCGFGRRWKLLWVPITCISFSRIDPSFG